MAQLVGHRSAKQKVAGSIPSQDTCLGCRVSPQLGCIQEATNRCFFVIWIFLSLSLSLLPSPSLSLSKKIFLNVYTNDRLGFGTYDYKLLLVTRKENKNTYFMKHCSWIWRHSQVQQWEAFNHWKVRHPSSLLLQRHVQMAINQCQILPGQRALKPPNPLYLIPRNWV